MSVEPLTSMPASVPSHALQPASQLLKYRRLLVGTGLLVGFLIYYGIGLYPGVGGWINAGDSAKFQVLAHAPIMVHGPGYPFYLMAAAVIRALELPVPGWWQITFMLSAFPGALANVFAFLIAERASGSIRFGVVAALILGSAHLMAVQSTEAEVYALNIAFILAVIYFLLLFVETERLIFFLAGCAIYAVSFGNHLMMVMLLPIFIALSVLHRQLILRPQPVAIIAAFVVLGASQYLYLLYAAYDPDTAYSEYMPLPPPLKELAHYIFGTYFSSFYGSGLESLKTLAALGTTLQKAHPWISIPLISAGLLAFIARGLSLRDTGWRKIVLIYAGALCFLPFVLWYGAWDIEAFHLPVLALVLVGATASIGWVVRSRPTAFRYVSFPLLLLGVVRVMDTGSLLTSREPALAGIVEQINKIVAALPKSESRPVLALGYDVRMAAMYHEFAGSLRQGPDYRLSWHIPEDLALRSTIEGAMMPESALHFVRTVQRRRPDLDCEIRPLDLTDRYRLKAYGFRCAAGDDSQWGNRNVQRDRKSSPSPMRRSRIRHRNFSPGATGSANG